MVPKIIGIHKLAELLDCSAASIYSHIKRKNWDAIPTPIRMGRRLAWLQTTVDDWFAKKMDFAAEEAEQKAELRWQGKKQGRPTKAEARAKRRLLAQTTKKQGD